MSIRARSRVRHAAVIDRITKPRAWNCCSTSAASTRGKRMKAGAAAVAAALVVAACAAGHTARFSQERSASQSGAALRSSELPLPRTAERAYHAVDTDFDRAAAFEIVAFMDQYWRLAGNPVSTPRSITSVIGWLPRGSALRLRPRQATVRVDEFPNDGHGWDYRVGTLRIRRGRRARAAVARARSRRAGDQFFLDSSRTDLSTAGRCG